MMHFTINNGVQSAMMLKNKFINSLLCNALKA